MKKSEHKKHKKQNSEDAWSLFKNPKSIKGRVLDEEDIENMDDTYQNLHVKKLIKMEIFLGK